MWSGILNNCKAIVDITLPVVCNPTPHFAANNRLVWHLQSGSDNNDSSDKNLSGFLARNYEDLSDIITVTNCYSGTIQKHFLVVSVFLENIGMSFFRHPYQLTEGTSVQRLTQEMKGISTVSSTICGPMNYKM